MKGSKKVIKMIILAVVLAILLIPAINPFLDEGSKAAVTAQLQTTFGGLLGGTGVLTPARAIAVAAVIITVWLVCTVVCAILSFVSRHSDRSKSMTGLFISLTKFVSVIVGLVWGLGVLGVDLAGIFASLGVLSLIVGFGAQSLIEDAITGIFIIFEGQYHVGDIIVLDEFRGVVKSIGIRTTSIEDAGGNLKIVNNSDIRNMQNRSRNVSVAVSEIGISYDARIEDVEKILIPALTDIYERNQDVFLRVPQYMGVEELGDSAVVLRVTVEVTEENFFIGRRCLNRELKILFDDHGIDIPFPQIVVHKD